MGNLKSTQALILLLLNLGTLLISVACSDCPYPTLPSKSPNQPPKFPPKIKPPVVKPPPTIPKPPPPPPHMPKSSTGKPPHISKLTQYFSWGYHYAYPHVPPLVEPPRLPRRPIVHSPSRPKLSIFATFPITPKSPIVYPPIISISPITPTPPVITPPPPPQETCPTLKLGACIDELGNLMHVGIGGKAKDTCCPMLAGLLDLDAAHCLCTAIRAKLLNINIVIPIVHRVLVDCGKIPPSGFQCPA